MKKLYLIYALLIAGFECFPQEVNRRIALVNGVIHVGNGVVHRNGTVILSGARIVEVYNGTLRSGTSTDSVIELAGKHVYPALINCNNVLGLHDAEAVRATRDFSDVGDLNAHNRALIAYNTDNIIVPTVRTNGVLYSQVTPRDGLISGSSSVMSLQGWNWEDAALMPDDGIHVNFPEKPFVRASDDESAVKNANRAYEDRMHALDLFFTGAVAYCKQAGQVPANLRFEAMRRPLNGKANIYFHADGAREILGVISFAERHRIPKVVIVGGRDAWKVTGALKRSRIPVMLGRINDLPANNDDDVDIINRSPFLLDRDSVLFCLQLQGDMEAMQSRNLAYNAGVAVAHGLSAEKAISAISRNAAMILGADHLIGTVEAGKLASLFVSDGDIMDFHSSTVRMAWLAGKPVELFNRQTELYLRYKARYGFR